MSLLKAIWLWVVGLWRKVFGKKAVEEQSVVNSLPLEMPVGGNAPGEKGGSTR